MISAVVFDDQIKLYWDYDNDFTVGYGFKVVKDSLEIYTTDCFNISFKNLVPETEHTFRVEMLSAEGVSIKTIGEATFKTQKSKENLDVTKPPYNAVGDGATLCTKAIQQAINDCKPSQKVYIPDGIYLVGGLDIKSDTELYLADNAVIKGTDNEQDYLPKIRSRFEGEHNMCYRSLINMGSLDEKGGPTTFNITIRGGSIIGGGEKLRQNIINREKIEVLKENGLENELNPPRLYSSTIPGRRRGRLLCTFNTKNVVLADCRFKDGPSWNLHFIYSEDIITCGCEIASHGISNGDGWDPDSSVNLTLFDTKFDTGDDCVAVKSGRNLEGYNIARPTKNVKIFDCSCIDGHGIAIGSEMSGGIDGVIVYNCDFALCATGVSVKTSRKRGGYLKNISFCGFKAPQIRINEYTGNDDGEGAPVPPYLENFYFKDIELSGVMQLTGTKRVEKVTAIEIVGYSEDNPVTNVTLKNIKLKYCGMSPVQVIDTYHTKNVTIENITAIGDPEN